MIQLSLFEDQKPILPTFELTGCIAERLGIRIQKQDRKDIKALFLKCMERIKPMMDHFDRMARKHGLDDYIPVDFFLFYDTNEKAARSLQAPNGSKLKLR